MTRDEVLDMLASPDVETRRQGVVALEEAVGKDVPPLLVQALGDLDWRVRKESVRVATALSGSLPVVPHMVDALVQSENVGLRNAALEVLGRIGSPAVQPLLDGLEKVPQGAKKFLIGALGDAGDMGAVPHLVRIAESGEANSAAAAIDALSRIGGPKAEQALRRRLRSDDPFQRMAALDGLNRLHAVIPYEELEPILDDRLVRRLVLSVLGRCGRMEAVSPLVEALADRATSVVAIAAVALTQLYEHSDELAEAVRQAALDLGNDARAYLRELVLRGDMTTRQSAAHLLLLAQDEDSLEAIMVLASEGALPPSALSALSAWGLDAADPLLDVQDRTVGKVRATALELAADLAADALAASKEELPIVGRIRAAIHDALMQDDGPVSRAGARSLTWWARPEDAPTLVELAAAGPGELAVAAGGALEALAGKASEEVADALSGVELDGPAGASLAGVVAHLNVPGAFDQLQAGLSAREPEVRRAVVNGLAQLGGQRAAELIAYALTDEILDVRTTAAKALGELRDEDGRALGADSLLLALDADSPAVQAAAARALGGLAEGRAVEPLRDLVRRGEAGVAVAAMEALRALQDPTLDDLLVEALAHPDEEVVKQALQAIRDARGPRTVSRLAVGLEHTAWHVRGLAARLLGDLGTEEALGVLAERMRRERDEMVKQAIERALQGRRGA